MPPSDLFDDVIGQPRAVAMLRAAAARPVHAYLLVGPAGTGKAAAATSFAAALLCPTAGDHSTAADHPAAPGGPGGLCDTCRRVVEGLHPDVVQVEREGASIGIGAAREVIRTAFVSPVEGTRKVIVLHDFHLVRDTGPALLKTLEEPPQTTVFVILAEYLPPELVTIASRCVKIEFDPLSPGQVVEALVAAGIDAGRAATLAETSGGRLERARLLASDPKFEERRRAWMEIPARLDGTGATAAAIADQLVAFLDDSVAPLKQRQAGELEQLTERNARAAEVVTSGSAKAKGRARATKAAMNAGVSELEERHRREQRRQRTDELRAGLAILAGAYRDRLHAATAAAGAHNAAGAHTPTGPHTTAGPHTTPRRTAIEAVAHIDRTVKNLEFNPGELLALQALLLRLGRTA